MAHIEFEQRAIEDIDLTREKGTPQYKNVDVAIIMADRYTRVEKRLDDPTDLSLIKERFPNEYASYKAGHEEIELTGMPLKHWAGIDAAMTKMCELASILTVEQLAKANEGDLDSIGAGARDLKSKAQAWLDQSDGLVVAEDIKQLKKENEALSKELEEAIRTLKSIAKEKAPAKKKG